MRGFDWNDLRAFLAIARAGRLTLAAQQLGVDHSTLSRRVAHLEQSLASRLFERRPDGFALTGDGDRLLREVEQMETIVIRMQSSLERDSHRVTGTVRLGTPEGFATYFLVPRLAEVVSAHPDLHMELLANPRRFSLSKREADFAVSMSRPTASSLIAKKLVDYGLGVYASALYVEQHGRPKTIEDLERHHWIGYVDDLMWTSELDLLPEVSTKLKAKTRISNVLTQLAAISGRSGIGILPHFIADQVSGLVRLLGDQVQLRRSYWLVTHEDTRNLARVRLLTDFIVEQARQAGSSYWQM